MYKVVHKQAHARSVLHSFLIIFLKLYKQYVYVILSAVVLIIASLSVTDIWYTQVAVLLKFSHRNEVSQYNIF